MKMFAHNAVSQYASQPITLGLNVRTEMLFIQTILSSLRRTVDSCAKRLSLYFYGLGLWEMFLWNTNKMFFFFEAWLKI